MKKKCKDVDVTHIGLITHAIHECMAPWRKRSRFDTVRLFCQVLDAPRDVAANALKEKGELYQKCIELIAQDARKRILSGKLDLPEIKQELRTDPSSGKTRAISMLSIQQLVFDHIAVVGLKPLFKRVGEYQVSAIKGRGVHYGKKSIEKWLQRKSVRYAVKLDIKDFYGSIDKRLLMEWLEARIGNPRLLWLISSLLEKSPRGMPIGSFLSQTLANIYLSDLYHHCMEACIGRRGAHQVKHALFYMDDLLLLGSSKRELKKAVFSVIEKARTMGLQVKPNWNVYKVSDKQPIDMMGFRFSRGCTTIRKRVFRKLRRMILRVDRKIRRHRWLNPKQCLRLTSYWGYLTATNSMTFICHNNVRAVMQTSFNRISNYAKNRTNRKACRADCK